MSAQYYNTRKMWLKVLFLFYEDIIKTHSKFKASTNGICKDLRTRLDKYEKYVYSEDFELLCILAVIIPEDGQAVAIKMLNGTFSFEDPDLAPLKYYTNPSLNL